MTCQWKYAYTVQRSHFTIVTYCTTFNTLQIFTKSYTGQLDPYAKAKTYLSSQFRIM